MGSGDGFLHAINADGSLRWKVSAGAAVNSAPVLTNPRVIVSTDSGDLVSITAAGKLEWRFHAGAPMLQCSPAAARAMVYVGDNEGWLHAVRAASGKSVWTVKLGPGIFSSPVVDTAGTVYVNSADGHVHAVSAAGAILWSRDASVAPESTLVIARDGLIYARTIDGGATAIGQPRVQSAAECVAAGAPACACQCEPCFGMTSSCLDDPGCRLILECAKRTSCRGSDCLTACQAAVRQAGGAHSVSVRSAQETGACLARRCHACGGGEP